MACASAIESRRALYSAHDDLNVMMWSSTYLFLGRRFRLHAADISVAPGRRRLILVLSGSRGRRFGHFFRTQIQSLQQKKENVGVERKRKWKPLELVANNCRVSRFSLVEENDENLPTPVGPKSGSSSRHDDEMKPTR